MAQAYVNFKGYIIPSMLLQLTVTWPLFPSLKWQLIHKAHIQTYLHTNIHTHTKTDLNVKVKFQLTFNNYIFIGGFTLEYISCWHQKTKKERKRFETKRNVNTGEEGEQEKRHFSQTLHLRHDIKSKNIKAWEVS